MKKLIVGDYVHVIICREGQWYTRHKNAQLLFLPELIALIENPCYCDAVITRKSPDFGEWVLPDRDTKRKLVSEYLYGYGYRLTDEELTDAGSLVVEKVAKRRLYTITTMEDDYGDRYEQIFYFDEHEWFGS